MIDITEAVGAYNAQRGQLAETRKAVYGKQNMIFAALALVLAGIAFYFYRSGSVGGTIAVLFIGVFALAIAFFIMRGSADGPGVALQATMREQLFPALFSNVGGLRFEADTKGFYDDVPAAIKPAGDRSGWGDLIEGTYQDHLFALNEVRISQSMQRDGKTVTEQTFKGISLRIGLAQSVPEVIVKENRLAVAKWVSGALGTGPNTPHVKFDDAAFEDAFDVHSSSEAFARAVFDDAGRAQFAALQSAHAQGALQLAATGETAYLLVEHDKNYFELPPLDRPFNEDTDGRRLQDEMKGFLDLIVAVRAMLERAATDQYRL